ncbi:MAG: glycosyltransferase family protein [Crocinitomicaceae bacterium]
MLKAENIINSKILISALDWGFGHTTRTSVLIKQLLNQNNELVFAGNSEQTRFIKKQFSEVSTLPLEGYNVVLSSSKNTYLQVLKQTPKILNAIKNERFWLQKQLKETPFDFVISDNRYGLNHQSIPCIILTHQTELQIPFGKKVINYFLRKQLNHFSTCWIPDYPNQSLSGDLSSGSLKIPTVFIGPLSRFKIIQNNEEHYDYLFLISGPFPEREVFLEKSQQFIAKHNLNAGIAVPFEPKLQSSKQTNIHLRPDTNELEKLINRSRIVVSKSGYTTIMDLIPFQKKVILLPTKRQFEQEYLSTLHSLSNFKLSNTELQLQKLTQ